LVSELLVRESPDPVSSGRGKHRLGRNREISALDLAQPAFASSANRITKGTSDTVGYAIDHHLGLMTQGELPLDRWLLGRKVRALSLAGALAGLVLGIWIVIQINGAFPGDRRFISWMIYPHPAQPFGSLAQVFALLAHPVVATLSVSVVWMIVDRRLGARYGLLVLAAVAAVGLNAILKMVFGPTPLQKQVFGEHALLNFPSGHVVYATVLCGLLAWFAAARGDRWITAIMLLILICMGPSRMIDGTHWPSDVLAGYCLGAAWTIVVLVFGLPWASAEVSSRPAER
jgi:membrane-associated phospholipid phosphatase